MHTVAEQLRRNIVRQRPTARRIYPLRSPELQLEHLRIREVLGSIDDGSVTETPSRLFRTAAGYPGPSRPRTRRGAFTGAPWCGRGPVAP